MDNIAVLELRFNRILKNKHDAEEQLIMLEMREKETGEPEPTKEAIEEIINAADEKLQNTIDAVNAIKEKREAAANGSDRIE